jgi:FKBP-type peptidyl-prolyl cis-trans isomerase
MKGLADRDRQFATLAANVEAHGTAKKELQGVINTLQQRVGTAKLDYTAVTEKNHTLATHLEVLRNELDSTGKSHLQLLADVKSLEQRISEAERNDLAAKDQKRALENSLTETASRHSDTQQQIKVLEGQLLGERERQQVNLNTVEEKLSRLQIEQESLINIQSGLTDSLRKNRRWATVVVGIAFLMGALAGISKTRDAEKVIPEQAAVTGDANPSLQLQVSQQDSPPLEEPLSLTGEAVESAAFETETAPIEKTEPTIGEPLISNPEADASEPLSNQQAGQINKLDLPARAPLKHPLTPSQAMAAAKQFEAKEFFEENARKEGIISLPSGLQYKVLKTGRGQSPGPTDMVILHYRGSLPDGREFDSSYTEKAPAAYRVDQVSAGWREALQRMQEGAQWELYIPPDLAHGAGTWETPRFLPLIYQIELISVSKAGASQP